MLARTGHADYVALRYWLNSGKHMLALSFSGFDPLRTSLQRSKFRNWRSRRGLDIVRLVTAKIPLLEYRVTYPTAWAAKAVLS